MADLLAILKEAAGTYQDSGRDGVPDGRVWDMVDYVPEILQAPLRQRGAWPYASPALTNPIDGMIYAPYKNGGRLLAANGTSVHEVISAAVANLIGSIPQTKQNPMFHRDRVIIPPANGTSTPKVLTFNGATYTLADLPASAVKGKYAVVFKDRTILGGPDSVPSQVGFSKPGDPTIAWDALSIINTSLALTGMGAQRNQILAFHDGSVERIRGTTPPDSTATDPTGDMLLDTLFDRAGCFDARSIAYWNDNIIFSDARGVHITDGAIVRNMAVQGGMVSAWRRDFSEDASRGAAVSVSGQVYRDLYITTIRSSLSAPVTYVIDIATRRWFRFGNINSTTFAFSIGLTEKIYGVDAVTQRVIDVSACFTPDATVVQTDGNGVNVLPVVETGWTRFGKREAFHRVRDIFLSYLASTATAGTVLGVGYTHDPADTTFEDMGGFTASVPFVRRRLAFRRRVYGMAFRITQLIPTKDTRIYYVAADATEEEATHL